MDISSLVMGVLSMAILGMATISMTNTANAVMHEVGLAPSNMTQTNSNNATMTATDEDQQAGNATSTTTVVRDSVLAYLDGRVLPADDFIHLYDSTPYMIMDGHVAAKLPCDVESQTPLRILIGQAPNMTIAQLELVELLSRPGETCMYHTDLHSAHGDHQGTAEGRVITDIAIMNPSITDIQFPATSTVVIGANEIMPLEGGHEEHGAEGEGASGEGHLLH